MCFFQMIFLNQKAAFFHMQTLVFFTNGVIGVPMINVDASAGKRRAGDYRIGKAQFGKKKQQF